VSLGGRDFYLGRHVSPASRAEFDRVVGEYLASGLRLPGKAGAVATDITINEMLLRYLEHVDRCDTKGGSPQR